jgi:hypothetical protein
MFFFTILVVDGGIWIQIMIDTIHNLVTDGCSSCGYNSSLLLYRTRAFWLPYGTDLGLNSFVISF